MHVIVNAISAHTGGMVTYTTNLLKHFSRHEVESTVCIPEIFPRVADVETSAKTRMMGMAATRFGAIRRLFWGQFIWRRFITDRKADILFSSANYGLIRAPVPQVLLVQGEISFNPVYREKVLPKFNPIERALFALRRQLVIWSAWNSDLVVFPSRVSLESVVEQSPGLRGRCVVNYLGTDQNLLKRNHSRPWRGDGMLRILYVSVFYPHKDPATLAVATRRLNEHGIPAHAWITMEPGDFRIWSAGEEDLRMVREEELAGYVSMGRLPHAQVGPSLANSDVMVFPSLAETFGFPLVEAMAAGVPVVAADTEIHREICGDAALYFEPMNPDMLVEHLKELDADPALRESCSRKGEIRVRTQYTWERHVGELIDAFAGLHARKKTGRSG